MPNFLPVTNNNSATQRTGAHTTKHVHAHTHTQTHMHAPMLCRSLQRWVGEWERERAPAHFTCSLWLLSRQQRRQQRTLALRVVREQSLCVCVCVCGHNHACLLCCSCARTFVKENGLHTLTSCRTLRTQCGRCVFTAERRAHFLSTNWDFVAHGWKPFSKQKQQQKSAHRISSPNNNSNNTN